MRWELGLIAKPCSTVVVDYCLCFLWQDNAPVIDISTAFAMPEGPEGFIVRTCKRPSNNSVASTCFWWLPSLTTYFHPQPKGFPLSLILNHVKHVRSISTSSGGGMKRH
jgi:hypothetical protein